MFKILVVFALTLSLSACMAAKEKPDKSAFNAQQSLDKHLLQWKKAKIHDYTYEFRRSCFCLQDYTKPVLISVKKGKITQAFLKENNKPLTDELKGNRQTINMLFLAIQDAIDKKAHNIKVKYNKQYGYPMSISVDYNEQIADEELYLYAKDLNNK